MKKRTAINLFGIVIVIALSAAQSGCNAESEALNMFSHQGLNLLRPARDYIAPGGMVFLTTNGRLEYDDPKDPITPESGNLTDFRAVILDEARTKTTGLGVALSFASKVIPIPISGGFRSNQVVSLKGIETTGVRLPTTTLDRFIGMPNTSAAAAKVLPRIRVFVVQEVYKATSLELHAADQRAFDVKLADGSAVSDCKQAEKPADDKSTAKSNDKGSSASKTANNAAQTPNQPAKSGKSNEAKGGTTTGATTQKAAPKTGGAVSICRMDDYTLKFQTKEPIPFAVRLAELERSGDTVQRKRGGAVVNTTLGGGGEIAAVLVSDKAPVIKGLQRRSTK